MILVLIVEFWEIVSYVVISDGLVLHQWSLFTVPNKQYILSPVDSARWTWLICILMVHCFFFVIEIKDGTRNSILLYTTTSLDINHARKYCNFMDVVHLFYALFVITNTTKIKIALLNY